VALAPTAQVWAFEPNFENYRCARVTLELNDVRNVNLVHAGLGAKHATLSMKTHDETGRALGGGSRIVDAAPGARAGLELIPVVTVDESVPADRKVSVLQLDVEGHEAEALAGAIATIQRNKPLLIVEVLPGSALVTSSFFAENILALGYREAFRIPGNLGFTCSPRQTET
jgi:FkbM family methyltransferase